MSINSTKREVRIREWTSIIQDRINSGLIVKDYCEQNNINQNAYFYWLRIIRENAMKKQQSSSFVELSLLETPRTAVLAPVEVPVIRPAVSQLSLAINGVTIVYAGNGSKDKTVRVETPKRLLNHSILTPSLAAAIFVSKYVNAVPLNRISEGFAYDGVNISRQVMAGWMIRLHEYYLEPVHRMMKAELMSSHVVHCDETPFKMTGEKGPTDPKSKDYMWVYHSPGKGGNHPVYLYEYDNGSRAGHRESSIHYEADDCWSESSRRSNQKDCCNLSYRQHV